MRLEKLARKIPFLTVLSMLLFESSLSYGCREFNPVVYFSQSHYDGKCYAVSVPPSHHDGQTSGGGTSIYEVEGSENKLVYKYDWFNKQPISLECGRLSGDVSGISMVRLGDSRGQRHPQEGQLGMEFYLNGKVIKSYTALEIAKSSKGYWATECGYRLFWKSGFFRYNPEKDKYPRLVFRVQTSDRLLEFDPLTGAIIQETLKSGESPVGYFSVPTLNPDSSTILPVK